MKKLALSLIGALSMLLLGGSALAQTVHIRLTVPFDFNAGNKILPAGEYELRSAGQPDNPGMLEICRMDGQVEMYIHASDLESTSAASETKVVFRHYGNIYFLSQVWTQGTRAGWEFPKTREEISEAKNASARNVTLAAKN
jgi:hypothetical protein